MQIIRGKHAGFCMGVALALKKLDHVIHEFKNSRKIYTLGPIIHNKQVMDHYKDLGVLPVDNIEKLKREDVVVIRAHGITKEVEEELKKRKVTIIDATCPKVKKAQNLIEKYSDKYTLLLYGEKDHPEVKGLISRTNGNFLVFSSLHELKNISLNNHTKYFLAAQTTQDRKEFVEVIDYLKNNIGQDFPILDTICDATKQRQKEAIEIAKKVDLMIIIGGFHSGNTRRLFQVVKNTHTPCIHIETLKDLPKDVIKNRNIIGITAGASTPDYIIDEVEHYLKTAK